MQLKIRRSQRGGLIGRVVFVLDVVAELAPKEKRLVDRYRLGGQAVYVSAKAEENFERARAGRFRAFLAIFADLFTKQVFTVKHLVAGQHIECKDLAELIAAEEQVRQASQNLVRFLAVAASFDGSEEVVEFAA